MARCASRRRRRIVVDQPTLVRLAGEVGIPAEEVRRVLAGDDYAAGVQEDVGRAAELGATGVPFFVLDGSYRISGAQSIETLLSALRTAFIGSMTAMGVSPES